MIITIDANGKSYKIGFTRDSIKRMERNGFDFSKAESRQITATLDLIEGAFRTYQPKMSSDDIFEVWGMLPKKDELMQVLLKMFNEPLAMLNDPDEDNQGNASWSTNP